MPPKDDPYNSCESGDKETTGTAEETQEEWNVYTYQVKYVEDNGSVITKLVEATHIHTDDDHVEIWWDDVLILMIQRMSLRQIRNVSLLDMPLV